MSGRRNDLRRSQGPEKVGIVGNSSTDTGADREDEYRSLYDGAIIPRHGYNNYRHPNHFRIWWFSYERYLKQLYATFANAIVTPDNEEKLSKASFHDFVKFVYIYSSGYISEFV